MKGSYPDSFVGHEHDPLAIRTEACLKHSAFGILQEFDGLRTGKLNQARTTAASSAPLRKKARETEFGIGTRVFFGVSLAALLVVVAIEFLVG